MRQDRSFWGKAQGFLARCQPDHPVLFFAPTVLRATAYRFQSAFPGLVSYAVKANECSSVLENLVGAGVQCFDVASLSEMERVRSVAPKAVLHYHNPVRSVTEIEAAAKLGVASWSVDCMGELAKLDVVARENTEIAVRLKLPVRGGAYCFGEKFGATPTEAASLLRQVVAMGFRPAMTFHPGTQCEDAKAWVAYIEACARVANAAGVRLARLNVGGGFPAVREKHAHDLEAIFAQIERAVKFAFGSHAPALVCEPGRAMVSGAFSLAARVKSVRSGGAVYLNDGIYGALAELRDMPAPKGLQIIPPLGQARSEDSKARIVFGPTCDSLDRLPEPLPLPVDIAEGDYVLFPAMGAYSTAIATRFNGYGAIETVTVQGN